MRRLAAPLGLLVFALVLGGCDWTPEPDDLVGDWRAVLESPGGELPFTLRISRTTEGLDAVVVNGPELAPVSSIDVVDRQVRIAFDWYDSEILARLQGRGDAMQGEWTRTYPQGISRLPFHARRGAAPRFVSAGRGARGDRPRDDLTGSWTATFTDDSGESPAIAEFRQDEKGRVTGTFLTPTGDYRFLAGLYEGGLLRLSTFDGAHVFLFEARRTEDGRLQGDFWSRDTYHATWTAERGAAVDPESWQTVGLANEDGQFRFSFPDLEGNLIDETDPRFAGKVLIVQIFGSWCPNCHDEAPLLAEWHRRWRGEGLEIVGLAYEFTGDVERDRRFVERFAEKYGLEYPLLLAGVSDKSEAAATLPDLEAIVAFPTTVFIGRDGRVRLIHSGFSGPGTGEHYERLLEKLEATLESLLAEPPPEAAG